MPNLLCDNGIVDAVGIAILNIWVIDRKTIMASRSANFTNPHVVPSNKESQILEPVLENHLCLSLVVQFCVK
jgi:hypothetical protein